METSSVDIDKLLSKNFFIYICVLFKQKRMAVENEKKKRVKKLHAITKKKSPNMIITFTFLSTRYIKTVSETTD